MKSLKPTSYNEAIKTVEAYTWLPSYVFVDFNKNTHKPNIVIWPCFSMTVPNRELFCSLSTSRLLAYVKWTFHSK